MSTATTIKHQFPPLQNDLILRAARGDQPLPRSPVWIMRQAGRYLPEFRAVRQEYDFFKVCQTPELACQVTLQPIIRFQGLLDAAIIFSDILVIPQALGMTVIMTPGGGPTFPEPLTTVEDVQKVVVREVKLEEELGYVYEAVTLTRQKLEGRVPLIGFSGAPWTLFAYMLDTSSSSSRHAATVGTTTTTMGTGSKTSWASSKTFLRTHPEVSCQLLNKLAIVCARHLVLQVRAGAQMLQVFDSWAGDLTPCEFQQFCLPYLKKISTMVKEELSVSVSKVDWVPMVVFAKGVHDPMCLRQLAESGYDVMGLDWTISPDSVQSIISDCSSSSTMTLQGNFDPTLLLSPPDVIRRTVEEAFSSSNSGQQGQWKGGNRHICNLGHGITPTVNPDHLKVFLEAVHEFGIYDSNNA